LKGSSNRNKRETRTPGTGGSGGVLHRAETREIEVAFGGEIYERRRPARKSLHLLVSLPLPPSLFHSRWLAGSDQED